MPDLDAGDGGYKPGVFPYADEANLFGVLFVTFFEDARTHGTTEGAWASFQGLLQWARAKAIKDPDFADAYDEITQGGKATLRLNDMYEIAGLLKEALERRGLWDYNKLPTGTLEQDEDTPTLKGTP